MRMLMMLTLGPAVAELLFYRLGKKTSGLRTVPKKGRQLWLRDCVLE